MTVEMHELLVSDFARLPDIANEVAGGKGASLGRLGRAGFPVPPGFVVCTSAFDTFLDEASGHEFLRARMADVTADNQRSLAMAAEAIREFILTRPLPDLVDAHIRREYEQLGSAAVAVRSSAVGEDGASPVRGRETSQPATKDNVIRELIAAVSAVRRKLLTLILRSSVFRVWQAVLACQDRTVGRWMVRPSVADRHSQNDSG